MSWDALFEWQLAKRLLTKTPTTIAPGLAQRCRRSSAALHENSAATAGGVNFWPPALSCCRTMSACGCDFSVRPSAACHLAPRAAAVQRIAVVAVYRSSETPDDGAVQNFVRDLGPRGPHTPAGGFHAIGSDEARGRRRPRISLPLTPTR
jgi:hypothetical protein